MEHLHPPESIGPQEDFQYVAVLLCANRMPFHENYLTDEEQSGSGIADRLRAAILEICDEHGITIEHTQGTQLLVRIYADDSEFTKAYKEFHLLIDDNEWQSRIVQSFNHSANNFIYTDLQNQPMAETQLAREVFFHYRNPSCQKIILGVNANPFLLSWLSRDARWLSDEGRIMLIETDYQHWHTFMGAAETYDIKHVGEPFRQNQRWYDYYMSPKQRRKEAEEMESLTRGIVKEMRETKIEETEQEHAIEDVEGQQSPARDVSSA